MRQQIWGAALLALGLVFGSAAGAERYLVNASAGADGDSHVDNDDPDAFAEFARDQKGGGAESYKASANAASGSLFATASRQDPLPFVALSTSSAATIEETIHFDELPPGPSDTVTITATLGVLVSANATTGFARAGAGVRLVGPTGECGVSVTVQAGQAPVESANCPFAGTAGGGTVTVVLTRDQLLGSSEVDIYAAVTAELESSGGIDGSAVASGGFSLARGGEPTPGTIYIDIDPPLAHSYTGSMTAFPVPEPGAPLLVVAGSALLATIRAASAVRTRGSGAKR